MQTVLLPFSDALTESGRNYLADTCRSQQPEVAIEATKEQSCPGNR